MMKYLIVSDLHGSSETLQRVLDFYDKNHCDMLCLLGDILNYGPRNGLPEALNPQQIVKQLNERSQEIIAVRGNCDSEVDQMLLDFPLMADYALLVDNGCKIFLTHGHLYHKEHLPKGGFDCFFYGHTHLWELERKEEGLICNVGSITFPKENRPPTFALYCDRAVTIYHLNGTPLKTLSLPLKD